MGGLFGLVGLGSVNGSQNTTPLEALEALESLESVLCTSAFSLVAKIELCETPVECDFEMSEAAEGVAFCSTGRPMTGLEGTRGSVEDLGNEAEAGLLSSVDEFHGRVEVFDNKGMVADVGGNLVGNVTVEVVSVASIFLPSTSSFNLGLGGGGGGAFFFLVGEFSLGFKTSVILSALGVVSFLVTASTAAVVLSAVLRLFTLWLVEAAIEGTVKALPRPPKLELWGKASLGSAQYTALFRWPPRPLELLPLVTVLFVEADDSDVEMMEDTMASTVVVFATS